MLASREAVKQKRQDALDEQKGLEPKVDALVARTRELQKQVIIIKMLKEHDEYSCYRYKAHNLLVFLYPYVFGISHISKSKELYMPF